MDGDKLYMCFLAFFCSPKKVGNMVLEFTVFDLHFMKFLPEES